MTSRTLNGSQKDLLEQFIDSTSLATVLHAIADIASSKAEHVGASYADGADLAQRWNRAAKVIDATAAGVAIGGVS